MIPSIRRPLVMLLAAPALGIPTVALAQVASAPAAAQDPIAQLVARLDLEQYKATIKGLTQFGDRRQGTDRNRAAVNWIEVQQELRLRRRRPPEVRLSAASTASPDRR